MDVIDGKDAKSLLGLFANVFGHVVFFLHGILLANFCYLIFVIKSIDNDAIGEYNRRRDDTALGATTCLGRHRQVNKGLWRRCQS